MRPIFTLRVTLIRALQNDSVDMLGKVIHTASHESLLTLPTMKTLYKIQARSVGSDLWYSFSMGLLSSEQVISSLADLASDDTTVYRAVPVES